MVRSGICLCASIGLFLVGAIADGRQLDRSALQPSDPSVQTAEDPGELELEATRDDLRGAEEDEEIATLLGPGWHEWGGISATYVYTGEVFTLARGGFNTNDATKYRGDFDLLIGLDTEAMQLWRGGLFNIYAFNTHGRTLTADYLGDAQYYSNIDTSPKPADVTELGEYWYEHTLGDGGFSVKIGKQDANADFAFGDLGGDFVNSSFATLPNVPLPVWPFQALGVSCFVHRDEWLTVGGGVYDGDRDRGQFWFSTDNGHGAFSILQADIRPRAGEEGALPSTIRLGAWYKTADTWDLVEDELHDGNYGFYGLVDQLLWGEADDSTQGLGAFVQYSWAPADRNWIEHFYASGLTYRGLFSGRDEDLAGVGIARVSFAGGLRETDAMTAETAVEAFYKVQLRPWASLQPDLQYIANPMGNGRDAILAGLRYELAL